MLDFKSLLTLGDIDPGDTLIVRHVPVEKQLRQILPWLVVERPELWHAYQRVQWHTLEKAMTRARTIASFIGEDAGTAIFAGLYRIGPHEVLDHAGYHDLPGNRELMAIGMTGRTPDMPDCLAFELDPLDLHREWIGRLTIQWPLPYQTWWRRAERGTFPVLTIEAESRFVRKMPDWEDIVLSWQQLQNLPGFWNASLSQWRGIYLIYDVARRASYVGSASGAENIQGRWRDYARNGHGGHMDLKNSKPEDLRFSILQRTSPDLDPAAIIEIEASWKKRLHTREFGMNRN